MVKTPRILRDIELPTSRLVFQDIHAQTPELRKSNLEAGNTMLMWLHAQRPGVLWCGTMADSLLVENGTNPDLPVVILAAQEGSGIVGTLTAYNIHFGKGTAVRASPQAALGFFTATPVANPQPDLCGTVMADLLGLDFTDQDGETHQLEGWDFPQFPESHRWYDNGSDTWVTTCLARLMKLGCTLTMNHQDGSLLTASR